MYVLLDIRIIIVNTSKSILGMNASKATNAVLVRMSLKENGDGGEAKLVVMRLELSVCIKWCNKLTY